MSGQIEGLTRGYVIAQLSGTNYEGRGHGARGTVVFGDGAVTTALLRQPLVALGIGTWISTVNSVASESDAVVNT